MAKRWQTVKQAINWEGGGRGKGEEERVAGFSFVVFKLKGPWRRGGEGGRWQSERAMCVDEELTEAMAGA